MKNLTAAFLLLMLFSCGRTTNAESEADRSGVKETDTTGSIIHIEIPDSGSKMPVVKPDTITSNMPVLMQRPQMSSK